jgi:hypothetical protein
MPVENWPTVRSISITRFCRDSRELTPYRQAYARGVMLIGATAHYVSADLDEGPIIEQAVERVDHPMSVEQLTALGNEIEAWYSIGPFSGTPSTVSLSWATVRWFRDESHRASGNEMDRAVKAAPIAIV